MPKLQIIAEHSFLDMAEFKRVIDVGCRYFALLNTSWIAEQTLFL
jgi:hypothetical protein